MCKKKKVIFLKFQNIYHNKFIHTNPIIAWNYGSLVLIEFLFWMTAFLECWMSNGGSQLSDPWFSHATQSGKVWVQWELWVSSRNSGYWKFNKIFTICPYNNFFPYEHSIFSLFQWIQTLKKCIWMYNVCITDGDFATL